VEYSMNLAEWSPASLLAVRADGPTIARETWGVVADQQSSRFLRLRIVK